MRFLEAQSHLTKLLAPFAGEEARREAELLLAHCMGVAPGVRCEITEEAFRQAETLAERRFTGEPLQYILGEWEFMGLSFTVGPGILIPRPETELLCELALSEPLRGKRVLDLCCGSGCIGISLAKLGGASVTFSDISPVALAYAQKNARRNGVEGVFSEGNLFAPVSGTFDLIAVNPPYLTAAEMADRQKELRFEPETALYGGEDGLDFYKRLAAEAESYLVPGGRLLMEIGYSQGAALKALFPTCSIHKDLSGLDRVVAVRRNL